MKTFLLAFLLFPLFYYSQQDTNGWYYVGTGVDGTKNYIKNLERKNSDTFSAWIKMALPSKKNKKGITVSRGYYLQYWTAYCYDNEYSVSDTTLYNSKGTPTDSFDRSDEGIKKVIPDSVAEGITSVMCEAGKMLQN
ncbi:hypothetical protein DRF65_00480 [Chryseobacterium pennae]|uniref:Uncharacterized protein n=1 Tax=Chryseobacterium pennae TaxID=2258962 RepID=A0A3D9CEN1_9FLAO|nr:hypothetical protein [Chryseobacterium pennae]REC64086.1 hypothetical protein DRF65_00480 [Chryseobacterium pennae]